MTPHLLRTHCWLTVLLMVAVAASVAPSQSAPPADRAEVRVAVLLQARQSHRQAASVLAQEVRDAGYACTLIELAAGQEEAAQQSPLSKLIKARPTIVATAGTKATALALQTLPMTPVVFFLVPNAPDAPLMAPDSPDRGRVAGVTTDIAPGAQLAWLAQLAPDARRIGVLSSARSAQTASRIRVAAKERGLAVIEIKASKEAFMPAVDALTHRDCDAAIMIPDAHVYNSVSVQRLLLWGVRQKKPVLAFSVHVVKAGALAGQYGERGAIGHQAAGLVRRVLQGEDISTLGLQYPDRVDHAVNERTADLIGITLDRKRLPPDTVRFGGSP